MSKFEISQWSNAMGMHMGLTVMTPDNIQKNNPPKVLYLLHGYSDDQTIFSRWTMVEYYAREYNLMIVMPTTHHGCYTDIKNGFAYFTYIAEDLPNFIENTFHVATGRENTFAAGISMGGFGTLKLGLNHPEKFCKIAPISSVIDMKDGNWKPAEYEAIFGDEITEENNPFLLLEKNINLNKDLPKIFQQCGKTDFLLDDNRRFFNKASELGYDITFEEADGDHGWVYWDKSIKKALKFFMD